MSSGDPANNFKTDVSSEKKSISFKDWKLLKDGNSKKIEKSQSNGRYNASGNRFSNNFNGPKNAFNMEFSNHLPGNRGPSFNNFNGMNNFNNFNMRGDNCGAANNRFNNYNPVYNNSNCATYSGFNNCGGSYNSSNTNDFQNSYRTNRNEYGGFNQRDNNNVPNSENFFTSDCAYPQRDTMQKPLINPFRQFNNNLQWPPKDRKQKKNFNKPNKKSNFPCNNLNEKPLDGIKKRSDEPEVYISNPKLKGKPFVPKPKIPEVNLEITKEEKKQQWKEYRQAMKPFKNRDFYNAKRVVQRLGKLPPSELDEKQMFRLSNAREYVDNYKTRLDLKYATYYVKAEEDSPNKIGELFVLQKGSSKSALPIISDESSNKIAL